jgi:hypothetical protein
MNTEKNRNKLQETNTQKLTPKKEWTTPVIIEQGMERTCKSSANPSEIYDTCFPTPS